MRITQIAVSGLFGVFDHKIPLHLDDRITIIHGPNGFGKTTLLKMLDGLFNRRYDHLVGVPFNRFQVDLGDGGAAWVTQTRGEHGHPEAILYYQAPDWSKPKSFSLTPLSLADHPTRRFSPLSMLEDLIDGLARVGPRRWRHVPTGELLSLDEVIARFGYALPERWAHELGAQRDPEWWVALKRSVQIRFITAQRLFSVRGADKRGRRPEMVEAVTEYSEKMAEIIQKVLAESAERSQALDRTFPARLVKQLGRTDVTDDGLRHKLRQLEERRSKLRDAGLLGKRDDLEFLPADESIGEAKDVLAVYVKDVEEKLSIFDEIASKIELLTTIINRRFLYKGLTISRENGFVFTTPDGTPLTVTKLSSGEQHQLVLLFHLLFNVDPDSLVLIDEPELSLHVAWQQQFLADLHEITKLALFDVLVATHSPQIIHDRWDLTVKLEGPDI